MRKILSTSSLLIVFLSSQTCYAMERAFPVNVINESWKETTQFTGLFAYEDGTERQLNVVLGGVSDLFPSITTSKSLPAGIITSCKLYLRQDDPARALIASLTTYPDTIPIVRIILTINDYTITPNFRYGPPPGFENHWE